MIAATFFRVLAAQRVGLNARIATGLGFSRQDRANRQVRSGGSGDEADFVFLGLRQRAGADPGDLRAFVDLLEFSRLREGTRSNGGQQSGSSSNLDHGAH
ncbi:hypothetical protein VZ95_12090 [Elstera litoralis]|uniref:Uncharacterized protein n=1 Tax=Elstera litoralis TaxID=552518 RepID=A0A0F3IS09_9PROT|nr:hypothetical protein [Elstera litoralis]KJV09333.1 hypothetical protein VZ95_12090 [Elstera litoralis]